MADHLEVVGLLAMELFLTQENTLIFNEIAPRPHNSFHWTIEGCKTSQFQQLIRSLSGLPFGDISVIGRWHMRNILGHSSKEELKSPVDLSLAIPTPISLLSARMFNPIFKKSFFSFIVYRETGIGKVVVKPCIRRPK